MSSKSNIARAAKQILESEAFTEVTNHLVATAFAEFCSTEAEASANREQIHARVRAIEDIRATLRNLAQEVDNRRT
jgi:hypothetical protein